jgi:hypothetical protein
MLKNVLQEISAGRARGHAELAQRLGISEGLLMQMVVELVRKGYLELVVAGVGCAGCCSHCGGAKRCPAAPDQLLASRLWVLTAKGRNAAQADH